MSRIAAKNQSTCTLTPCPLAALAGPAVVALGQGEPMQAQRPGSDMLGLVYKYATPVNASETCQKRAPSAASFSAALHCCAAG